MCPFLQEGRLLSVGDFSDSKSCQPKLSSLSSFVRFWSAAGLSFNWFGESDLSAECARVPMRSAGKKCWAEGIPAASACGLRSRWCSPGRCWWCTLAPRKVTRLQRTGTPPSSSGAALWPGPLQESIPGAGCSIFPPWISLAFSRNHGFFGVGRDL